jgi:hypothetical protein
LQRAITDFAADDPFAKVPLKLREHYGFEIGERTIQRIALGHAEAIFASGKPSLEFPQTPGQHKPIVAQTDGGMIPVVEPDANQKDKRRGKTLSWREAKISFAHAKGSRMPVYGGGIEGGVEVAGRLSTRGGGDCSTARFVRASGRIRVCARSGRGAVDRRPDRRTVRRSGQLSN